MDVTMLANPAIAVAVAAVESGTTNPFDFIAPIISTGMVGIFLLMVLFRFKIMPTYVHEDAKREWERERTALEADKAELKRAVTEAQSVYTEKVIPTLTRILDNEQELVAIRRAEQARRQQGGGGGVHAP